VYICELGWWNS